MQYYCIVRKKLNRGHLNFYNLVGCWIKKD